MIDYKYFTGIEVDAVRCQHWNNTHNIGILNCKSGCLAAWYNISGDINVQHKNCWGENGVSTILKDNCEGEAEILDNKRLIIVCHCKKDMCNVNLTWDGTISRGQ